jgi:hypothetical protein
LKTTVACFVFLTINELSSSEKGTIPWGIERFGLLMPSLRRWLLQRY